MTKKYDYLIVGAGLFGSVFTYFATKAGKSCLVIDKRKHIGGNIYCEKRNDINIHMYGAHIFHTDNEDVWNFANKFVKFNHYINSPIANYKGKIYNLPFNMNTFNALWGTTTPVEAQAKIEEQKQNYKHITEPQNLEEQALKICGSEIYEKFIKGYTQKQWGKLATELPASIIKRVPFRFTYNNNYFNDPYQGIPIGGYNQLIEKLLSDAEVQLEKNYIEAREHYNSLCHNIIYTGCIDEFFNYEFGKLDYRSLKFEHKDLELRNFQGNAVVNYNDYEIPFTRILEHKHFEFGNQDTTTITYEYPHDYVHGQEPYYPIGTEENIKKLALYEDKAKTLSNITFGGRLGQYKYMDMDDTIYAAMQLKDRLL